MRKDVKHSEKPGLKSSRKMIKPKKKRKMRLIRRRIKKSIPMVKINKRNKPLRKKRSNNRQKSRRRISNRILTETRGPNRSRTMNLNRARPKKSRPRNLDGDGARKRRMPNKKAQRTHLLSRERRPSPQKKWPSVKNYSKRRGRND